MAFVINKITSGQSVELIANSIRAALSNSRFVAQITTKRNAVEIRTVRLTYKKDYCGNHPLPCPVRPGIHKAHKRLLYLEGADWVGFNDLVNDVLDSLACVCNCASSHVVIRQLGARCVRYDAQPLRNGIDSEWVKNSGAFENHMASKTPIQADYPEGTPGFATAYGKPNYPEHALA